MYKSILFAFQEREARIRELETGIARATAHAKKWAEEDAKKKLAAEIAKRKELGAKAMAMAGAIRAKKIKVPAAAARSLAGAFMRADATPRARAISRGKAMAEAAEAQAMARVAEGSMHVYGCPRQV